jgi:ribosomal protein S18 acetylase RimI-like enzyme
VTTECPTRALRDDERDLAVDTLARAFDDDPWFRWVLPEAPARFAWISWFHGVSVDLALRARTAVTLADGPSQGAITVLPPGVFGPDMTGWLRALRHPPRHLPTWRLAHTGLRTQARLDALHPREPVVYVHVLGVHPAQKGRGLGGALLRAAFAMAAARQVPVFLETSNPVNLGFYKRFGLNVRAEITLDGAPPLWTLQTDGPPPAR